MIGVVLKSTGSWYVVRENTTGQLYECRIKGKLRIAGIKSTNLLAVGDSVRFEEEETAPELGVISGIETRKNYIIRKSVNLSKRSEWKLTELALRVMKAYRACSTSHYSPMAAYRACSTSHCACIMCNQQ